VRRNDGADGRHERVRERGDERGRRAARAAAAAAPKWPRVEHVDGVHSDGHARGRHARL